MAKRPNDRDESQGKRRVRLKRDIVPLSSIFDKESKATTINKYCRHTCITANDKRKHDQSEDEVRPLTKQQTNDNEQKTATAFDPGNEILDGGEGKNNMHNHLFEMNTNAKGTNQDNANTCKQDTTRHLPGISAPTLQSKRRQQKSA